MLLRYCLAGAVLLGFALVIRLLEKKDPAWKDYPGFRFFPSGKDMADWLKPEFTALIPLLAAAAVLLGGAMELAALSIGSLAPLRLIMQILPVPALLAQLAELAAAAAFCRRGRGEGTVSVLTAVKLVMMILWVLCMFVNLFYRGFLL